MAEILMLNLGDEIIPMPPTEDDLPYEDGIPMESQRHQLQMELLKETLDAHWRDRDDVYVAANMGVYYGIEQAKRQDFRAPDFFFVLGTTKRVRKSWVIWQEEKAPDFVIELLSGSTAAADRGIKKQIYQDVMRVWEYVMFDVQTGEAEAYRMNTIPQNGAGTTNSTNGASSRHYITVPLNETTPFVSSQTRVGLRLWEGMYGGVSGVWLRWFDTRTKLLLPTGWERATEEEKRTEQERKRAEQERKRADSAEARAAALAAKFRELGIDPDAV
jgi:Uma2 family endonuclease